MDLGVRPLSELTWALPFNLGWASSPREFQFSQLFDKRANSLELWLDTEGSKDWTGAREDSNTDDHEEEEGEEEDNGQYNEDNNNS